MDGREAHVRPRDGAEAGVEAGAGGVDRVVQLALEAREALLGERVEEGLLAGEVPARRRVTDADLAGELAQRLLPRITDRVVTVSSGAHRFGAIRLDDLDWEHGDYQRWPVYGQSKLANLLLTLELQRRLTEAGSPVRALAAHPGWSATNLQSRTENPLQQALMARS
jgi:NAD(P)-dependent dehydrogenase (short-subunit alcohol dehydrogenase family)